MHLAGKVAGVLMRFVVDRTPCGAEIVLAGLSAALAYSLLAYPALYSEAPAYLGPERVLSQESLGWVCAAAAAVTTLGILNARAPARVGALAAQLFLWSFLLVLFLSSGVPSVWPPFCLVLALSSVACMAHLGHSQHSDLPILELHIILRFFRRR